MRSETSAQTIAKILRHKPEAISIILLPGQCASFAKQLRSSGYRGEIFGFEMMSDVNEIQAAGGALDGVWYVDGHSGDEDFIAKYTKAFGSDGNYGAGNGFDMVQILAKAWAGGARTGPALADHLRELKDYQGALGTYSATGDNRFTLAAVVR